MDTQQVKQYKILLIGDACQDIYHFGTCDRLSPEAPVPVFKKQKTEYKPGMVLNVEQTFFNLKQTVKTFCNDERIVKERFVDQKSNQHLIRIDEEPSIKPFDANLLFDLKEDYEAIVISDYDKGFITNKNSKQILEYAYAKSMPIFVDSKKKNLSLYERCIIKINEEERYKATSFPENYNLITTLGKYGAEWSGLIFPAYPTEVL